MAAVAIQTEAFRFNPQLKTARKKATIREEPGNMAGCLIWYWSVDHSNIFEMPIRSLWNILNPYWLINGLKSLHFCNETVLLCTFWFSQWVSCIATSARQFLLNKLRVTEKSFVCLAWYRQAPPQALIGDSETIRHWFVSPHWTWNEESLAKDSPSRHRRIPASPGRSVTHGFYQTCHWDVRSVTRSH